MNLIVNVKDFQKNFIKPILDVEKDSKVAVFSEADSIYALCKKDGVILYSTFVPNTIDEPLPRFNINLAQLKKGLDCLKDKEMISLKVKGREMSYSDDLLRFNVKLLEDSVIPPVNQNLRRMENFEYPTQFTITPETMNDLKKAKGFSTSPKFYVACEDGKIFFTLADKLTSHDNEISVFITDQYKGEVKENIYEISVLDLLCEFKCDIVVKIMENGSLMFEIVSPSSTLRYLVLALKK